jgi:hypothetical protein
VECGGRVWWWSVVVECGGGVWWWSVVVECGGGVSHLLVLSHRSWKVEQYPSNNICQSKSEALLW